MRVTELQTFGVLSNQLTRARVRGLELQQRVSTGKLVRQPSDDPSAFNHIALDKSSLAAIEQRLRNITFGQTRLDLSDKILTIPSEDPGRITANLRGPLLFNTRTRLCKQLVLSDDVPTRYPLFPVPSPERDEVKQPLSTAACPA